MEARITPMKTGAPDWKRHRQVQAEWSGNRQKMPRHKRQYGHSVHPGGGPDNG